MNSFSVNIRLLFYMFNQIIISQNVLQLKLFCIIVVVQLGSLQVNIDIHIYYIS